jgi:hypothetical protein
MSREVPHLHDGLGREAMRGAVEVRWNVTLSSSIE